MWLATCFSAQRSPHSDWTTSTRPANRTIGARTAITTMRATRRRRVMHLGFPEGPTGSWESSIRAPRLVGWPEGEQNRHSIRRSRSNKTSRRRTMNKPDFDRSRRRVLKAAAGAGALAGTLGFPAIVRAQQDTLKFGHLTPRTGFLGQLGDYGFKAASMAWDEVNAAAGLLGRKITPHPQGGAHPPTAGNQAPRVAERD